MQNFHKPVKCHYTDHEHKWYTRSSKWYECEWCLAKVYVTDDVWDMWVACKDLTADYDKALAMFQDYLTERWLEGNKTR